jgi:hypothetical protein
MDIAGFNKILSTKIRSANLFEKEYNITQAVKLWLEVSEMTLNASKNPKLDVAFRSMLIRKTEQIVAHIKELKSRVSISQDYQMPMEIARQESLSDKDTNAIDIPSTSNKILETSEEIKDSSNITEPKIIQESDIENLPIGFKEIESSKDFKIITPHDSTIVKKRLEQADKMDEFFKSTAKKAPQEPPKTESTPQSASIKLEPFSDEGNLVCFACGTQNPKNSEKCKDCGTKLS